MITILKPGLLTTIQDLGRVGYQKYGVVVGGAMDLYSHRIANLLVGNEEHIPTIEITLMGPVIQFHQDTLIAICGGDLTPMADGKSVPMWRPFLVRKEQVLRFEACVKGCRTYMAIAGGLNIPFVMGSASTYVRGEMGGVHGRALQVHDEISIGTMNWTSLKIFQKLLIGGNVKWSVPSKRIHPIIRIVKGREYKYFSTESRKLLYESVFEISTKADRMGYRLVGPALLREERTEMISEAVDFGTIQVTPEGNPIILLADRQTTGGYPRIAQVISVDLPMLAQMKPGDKIMFKEICLQDAQQLFRENERFFSMLRRAIELKI